MKLLDTTKTLYPTDKADELADEMNSYDDDWVYKANHDPTGRSKWAFIDIYDENGEFVGNL